MDLFTCSEGPAPLAGAGAPEGGGDLK